jgi:hypothetical protein
MSARIIETNESPLKTIDVDGITVDLIENALKKCSRRDGCIGKQNCSVTRY